MSDEIVGAVLLISSRYVFAYVGAVVLIGVSARVSRSMSVSDSSLDK